MQKADSTLAKELTLSDGLALVVGTVIGSGIFLVPAVIAQELPSLIAVIAIWIAGGVLSVFGALTLAEMSSLFPQAGGVYVYLREIYNRPVAFVYGWALLVIIQSGTIASLAVGFGLYCSQVFSISGSTERFLPAILILTLSALNIVGLRCGKSIQNISTFAKVVGMALLAASLFWKGHRPAFMAGNGAPVHANGIAVGIAMVSVLWAYEGWHTVSFASSEFKNPQRDVPRSLFLGTSVCVLIYLVMTLGYYAVLSSHTIASSIHVAATAAYAVYGSGAAVLISLLVMTSIVGATNGMILTGPRVYYAMAKDRLFFASITRINSRFRTPIVAIAVQAIWACALTLIGSFQELYSSVIFSAWIFYGLTVFGLLILRRRQPMRPSAFRTPAYPFVPLAFVAAAAFIVVSTVLANPKHAVLGISLVLLGLPIFVVFRAFDKRSVMEQ